MRAEFVHHTDTPLRVTKGDEVFAENAHPHRVAVRLGHLFGETGGKPELAHELAHGGLALHAAQKIVFLICEHEHVLPNWPLRALVLMV